MDIYSKTPEQIEAMWDAYRSAPDETTVADLRAIVERAAANCAPVAKHSALIDGLEEIDRNLLDEASRPDDSGRSGRSALGSAYDLGKAAGVRMALRLVRDAVAACTCEWNPACPEHGVTG